MQNSGTVHKRGGWLTAAILCLHSAFSILHSVPLSAQATLVDRIIARVQGDSITLTDLRAAQGLGIVDPALDVERGTRVLVDRYLMLSEVQRFPPPEPLPVTIDTEVLRLRQAIGTRLPALMESTGLDDARLRDLAADSLRLESYIAQRFGTTIQVTDEEAEGYFLAHQQEFRRNGAPVTFDDVAAQARERAGAARRQAAVDRWIQDLRARADITIPPPRP